MVRRSSNLILWLAGAALAAPVPCAAQLAIAQAFAGFAQAAVPGTAGGVSDIFIGKGVVGPYMLSWKAIDPDSESVSVGARHLGRGSDYTLDPATGTLTFKQPLRSSDIARVDYHISPGKAAANPTAPAVPMQLKLFDQGNGALSLSALLRPGGAAGGASQSAALANLMLLGLGSTAKLAPASTLTSRLFLDANGGNIVGRGALQLQEASKTRIGQFTAGYTRAGAEFKAGEATGIAAGKEILQAGAALRPYYGITASASFTQTTDLPAAGRGATVGVLTEKLTGGIAGFKFQATHTDTATDNPDGSTQGRVADRIQVDRRLDARTQATALIERSETQLGGLSTVSQTSTLSLRTNPSEKLSIAGTFQNMLLPAGNQDATSLKVEATPQKAIKLGISLGDRFGTNTSVHSREASLELTPAPIFSVTGVVQMKADGPTEALAGGFNATARAGKFLELGGGLKLRDISTNGVPDPNAPDTYNLKVSLKLLRDALRLTGGYTQNPEDEKGVMARTASRSVGLESRLGRVDLAGSYSEQEDLLATKLSTTLDARLGWRFTAASQIVAAFKEALTQDSALLTTDTYSLSLTHRIGSAFDLSLSGVMTTYEKDRVFQANRDYKAEARLGLRF